ncbi:MAG: hypothetical protein ACRETY_13760, partial [Steroidobacteraceae bacterium]
MTNFLDDYVPRRVTLTLPEGLKLRGLHLGQGSLSSTLAITRRGRWRKPRRAGALAEVLCCDRCAGM